MHPGFEKLTFPQQVGFLNLRGAGEVAIKNLPHRRVCSCVVCVNLHVNLWLVAIVVLVVFHGLLTAGKLRRFSQRGCKYTWICHRVDRLSDEVGPTDVEASCGVCDCAVVLVNIESQVATIVALRNIVVVSVGTLQRRDCIGVNVNFCNKYVRIAWDKRNLAPA